MVQSVKDRERFEQWGRTNGYSYNPAIYEIWLKAKAWDKAHPARLLPHPVSPEETGFVQLLETVNEIINYLQDKEEK